MGLWYPKRSPFDLEAFSDSDYAGASLDRKSTTGGCQFLGKRLISWQCKKQTIVANSTTKAEYVAAANCYGQVLWIQNQMLDYGFNFMNTKIYIDNESTICIVKNLVFHSKTKHIEIQHHFIRDSNEKKLIQVVKIHTDHNVADLLTKAFDDRQSSMVGFGEMRQLEVLRLILEEIGYNWYALTKNHTIYVSLIEKFWQTATIRTIDNGRTKINATCAYTNVSDELSIKRGVTVVEKAATTGYKSLEETGLDGGPRRQETTRGTSIQTRFERASKLSLCFTQSRRSNSSRSDVDTKELARCPKSSHYIEERRKQLYLRQCRLVLPVEFSTRAEQERAGPKEAIRLQEQLDEEESQRIARYAEVAKGHRARVELNEELTSENTSREMIETEAKRNKPMTQAQQRTYMSNYIKHMGSHTMQQLKRYTFDELKELFETTMKHVSTFTSIETEDKERESELAAGSSKRPRAEHDEEECVKKHKLEDNNAEKEELRACLDIVSGDEIAMDFESLATKYPIIDWKTHILTENMMYYQIIRADGSSKNYKIFSEMLDDFDRQDVVDLHRHYLSLVRKMKSGGINIQATLEKLRLVNHVIHLSKIFQEGINKVLNRKHFEKIKKAKELRKKRIDQSRWTITSRLKPETITDIHIYQKSKRVIIIVYIGNDQRNFDIHNPFKFGDFRVIELDESGPIIQKKKNKMVGELMTSLGKRYERLKKIPKELRITPTLPTPRQVLSLTLGRKRKVQELEPKTRILVLECNISLPEGIPFVNNLVIEQPENGMFFIDVFGDEAFQRMSDIHKVDVETLLTYLVMASNISTPANQRFCLALRSLIESHPDKEKLKSKKVKLKAVGYSLD
ncbi:hypothetical protein Tco_1385875 [Tanacetum coccineum]